MNCIISSKLVRYPSETRTISHTPSAPHLRPAECPCSYRSSRSSCPSGSTPPRTPPPADSSTFDTLPGCNDIPFARGYCSSPSPAAPYNTQCNSHPTVSDSARECLPAPRGPSVRASHTPPPAAVRFYTSLPRFQSLRVVQTDQSIVQQRGHCGHMALNRRHSEALQRLQSDSNTGDRLEVDRTVLKFARRTVLPHTRHSIPTWNLLNRYSSLAIDTVPPPQYTLSSTPTTALRTNNAPTPVGNPNIL